MYLGSDLVRVQVIIVAIVVDHDAVADQHLLLLLVLGLQCPDPCLMFHWKNDNIKTMIINN